VEDLLYRIYICNILDVYLFGEYAFIAINWNLYEFCRNPFLGRANAGHAKSQGLELFDSEAKVVVPLEVKTQPIAGIGMP
jgi:hypothetical protein